MKIRLWPREDGSYDIQVQRTLPRENATQTARAVPAAELGKKLEELVNSVAPGQSGTAQP